ncbi:MAG: protein translocase subunit SecF [Minisyncoccales bacterium]
MVINFLKYRKIYFVFTGILSLASLLVILKFGLNLGIDFTGGSILEIVYQDERPTNAAIRETLRGLDLGEFSIQPTDEKGLILRMKDISEETHQEIIKRLSQDGKIKFDESRFESIGPVVGQELKEKTKLVTILSLLAILAYVAIAFRKVNYPAKSWQYGLVSLLCLGHDLLIPLGIFAVLGKFYGVQMTIPIVAALLTILGYSINNVVVVFDRIRELLLKRVGKNYEETVNLALNQTLTRCLNTSLTTLFVLFAIFFFGGETLKYFALMLILGISFATYSALLLASPLIITWLKQQKRI